MSELVPAIVGGEPRTIVVAGDGGQSLSFQLPPGLTLDVESVVAEVDATGAGGPVTATLAVAEQSGVVIARKRQSETIDAGAPGSATWALRLADDGGSGASVTALENINDPVGVVIGAGGSAQLPWIHDAGATLLDLTVPTDPVVIAGGVYALSTVMIARAIPGPWVAGRLAEGALIVPTAGAPAGVEGMVPWQAVGFTTPAVSLSVTAALTAGSVLRYFAANSQAAGGTFQLGAFVQRVA